MLDDSFVKSHQDATRSCFNQTAQAIGRCVGGLTSKIHAKVDALGQLIKVILTSGQTHDTQVAHAAFAGEYCNYLIADKADDNDRFRETLQPAHVTPVILGKINRIHPIQYDQHIDKERNVVERRFFQKIKRFRSIATRYDKTARMYQIGIILVSILMAVKL